MGYGFDATSTAALSREHTIRNEFGLLTITGGKWTTYRSMAEDVVNRAAEWAGLSLRACRTKSLRIHGSDAAAIRALPCDRPLHATFPYMAADVIRAARHEMARTVEDVLSRRLRVLVLDAAAAMAMAPRVASLLAIELGRDTDWEAEQVRTFTHLARGYLLSAS